MAKAAGEAAAVSARESVVASTAEVPLPSHPNETEEAQIGGIVDPLSYHSTISSWSLPELEASLNLRFDQLVAQLRPVTWPEIPVERIK